MVARQRCSWQETPLDLPCLTFPQCTEEFDDNPYCFYVLPCKAYLSGPLDILKALAWRGGKSPLWLEDEEVEHENELVCVDGVSSLTDVIDSGLVSFMNS